MLLMYWLTSVVSITPSKLKPAGVGVLTTTGLGRGAVVLSFGNGALARATQGVNNTNKKRSACIGLGR